MSRPTIAPQRALSLTEELERLEQSITLTLQEIDHNFSKAHRIVTSSILPIVEQYAEQSREVWEGSKFWKQFFESSANVSLSGYEEHPPSESGQEITATEDSVTTTHTTLEGDSESYATPSRLEHADEDPDISGLSISPSERTPRPPSYFRTQEAEPADYTASTEHLHEDVSSSIDSPFQLSNTPSTPGRQQGGRHRDIPTTPGSAPFPPSTTKKDEKQPDPLLHRVLDKTYRIQATPLSKSYKYQYGGTATTTPKSRYPLDSPPSSPELEAPKLHSEIFSSPMIEDPPTARRRPSKPSAPKPGISVLTPAKSKSKYQKPSAWDSDDDLDDDIDATAFFGKSPPKTMQFHVPQTRLLKTPAKEASKRIVSDLLYTAGAGDTTEEYEDLEPSPSIVRRTAYSDDDSF